MRHRAVIRFNGQVEQIFECETIPQLLWLMGSELFERESLEGIVIEFIQVNP